MIDWQPVARADVVNTAVPGSSRATVASAVPPSKKVTVPLGASAGGDRRDERDGLPEDRRASRRSQRDRRVPPLIVNVTAPTSTAA